MNKFGMWTLFILVVFFTDMGIGCITVKPKQNTSFIMSNRK